MTTVKDMKQVGKMELFTVVLPDGTEIMDCKKMDSPKGPWIAGPSRSYVDKKTNETKWVSLVRFSFATQKEIMEALLGAPSVPVIDNETRQPVIDDDVPF